MALNKDNDGGRYDRDICDLREQQIRWKVKWKNALMTHQETLVEEVLNARADERWRETKCTSNKMSARRRNIRARLQDYLKYSRVVKESKAGQFQDDAWWTAGQGKRPVATQA